MSSTLSKQDRLTICQKLLEMGIDPSKTDLASWAHLAREAPAAEKEPPLTDSERLTVSRKLLEMGMDPTEADLESWAHLARGVKRAPRPESEEEDPWGELKQLGKDFLTGFAEGFEEELGEANKAGASRSAGAASNPSKSGTASPIEELEEEEDLTDDEKSVVGAFLLMGLALGYFVFPIDLIPDALLGVGQLDDLGFAGVAGANLVQAYTEQGLGLLEAITKALKWLVVLVAVGVVGVIVILAMIASQMG